MRDVLEDQLAARLRDLGDVVPTELEPPADLDTRVQAAKKAVRVRRSGAVLAVAAVFLVVVAIGTVLDGRTGDDAPVSVAPATDPLPEGTVMLGAKGRYVTARDATGKVLATMVTTTHGNVLDAQVTADHKTIFYRVTDPTSPCDKIARADINGRTSQFVARGDAFAISPDGTRLAVSGYGDLASRSCSRAGAGTVAVLDFTNDSTTAKSGAVYDSLVWDNDVLVARACTGSDCGRVVAWHALWNEEQLLANTAQLIARGSRGIYRVDPPRYSGGPWTVNVTPGDLTASPVRLAEIASAWTISGVVPTDADVFVSATAPGQTTPALYRVVDGSLEFVRATDVGAASPVFPIP
ncbi:MAG TPA: hypothetical protein VNC41_10285 [Acidimicrobiia bacterium]|nr:hypothetical protein [Acidimicrobiia bacterium]